MKVLFQTLVGSRLYGLNNAGSDFDWWQVIETQPKKKLTYNTHNVTPEKDLRVVDFGTWQKLCFEGAPQALEAMFAEDRFVVVDELKEFRNSYVAGMSAWHTYNSVMKKMYYEFDDFKHNRHMMRLGYNLRDLMRYGRFDPTLTQHQISMVNTMANRLNKHQSYEFALGLAYDW